ncbi:MAG: hypothetical protein D3910_27395 [Candidatus Electrothrix sp. ATG2]|nr:hypothetical protein [Candidatus Electrothrix sp. ATG2]
MPDSTDQEPENTPGNTTENNENDLESESREAKEGTAATEGDKKDETAEPDQLVSEQDAAKGNPKSGEPPESNASAIAPLPNEQQPEHERKEDTPMDPMDTTAVSSSSGNDKQRISGPSCTEVTPSLSQFFDKLEKKNYNTEGTSGPQPLQQYFNELTTQLLNNPPVVTHETDELYTILTNTAHFFRILGKDNMRLLQKVFKQEAGDFEKIAAEMYRLSIAGEHCVSGNKKLEASLPAVYEYAGFFLNTLGGRSYLFRRDPETRLLVNYYAVLVLDQAITNHQNMYGLDIREQLPRLIQEMEASNRLTHKERYLDKLYELAENYQALP